jgi:hypothetical protein
MSSRKFFSLQNGSSSSSSTAEQHQNNQQHNGHATYGFFCEPKVVAPEMAFFCFDVLHKELHGLDRHVEPHHIGIANSSL